MSLTLYRIGAYCSRRGGRVAGIWLVVLLVAGTVVARLDLDPQALALPSILALVVAVDYGLRIMSALRRDPSPDRDEAVGRAMGSAGPSVVCAAMAVFPAMFQLVMTGQGFLVTAGLAAFAVVFAAMLAAVTLVPALLAFAAPRVSERPAPAESRWGAFVTGHPVPVLVAGLALLAVAALGLRESRFARPETDFLPLYLVLMLMLTYQHLAMAFRSVLLAIISVAGYLLSIAATLGLLAIVVSRGPAGADPHPTLPVLTIIVVFGVAMDHQIFLGAGIRSALADGLAPEAAVRAGLARSRRVMAVSALVLTSLSLILVVGGKPLTGTLGLGLAAGVLLDVFVVRMTLMPAVLAMLGPRVWWLPRPLERTLALDFDLEGGKLRDHLRTYA
ncbi:MMPL family transporter [Nonomuraea sp. NPDC046802]|uniref:MMPL family transporter n=1 Tax=Nonomuraea sp. NPDC046802 TaxID=3154919 RepID=UPI0033DD2C5D